MWTGSPPPEPGGTAGEEVPSPSAPGSYTGLELWLHRAAVLLLVLICAGLGVVLVILPWSLPWTDNYLLSRFPALRPVVSHGFVRGLCSGLGVLDLWIGFSEAIHYHEEKPAQK
jgi:hypothetical protein